MDGKVNYQKKMELLLQGLKGRPKLLLHSCCAPCSSYVLSYLFAYFEITVFFFNPNIAPFEEFERRAKEQKRLITEMGLPVTVIVGEYCPDEFYKRSEGLYGEPEGGGRCRRCFWFRLEETAKLAKQRGYDYFTTTLSISPMKNAGLLNQLGGEAAEKHGVPYLFSDFKKKDGYKTSILLSEQFGLYRQDYCGCIFSKRQAD